MTRAYDIVMRALLVTAGTGNTYLDFFMNLEDGLRNVLRNFFDSECGSIDNFRFCLNYECWLGDSVRYWL
jgi:hypothetical protein